MGKFRGEQKRLLFFLNLEKGYDRVPRQLIWCSLMNKVFLLGISKSYKACEWEIMRMRNMCGITSQHIKIINVNE